MNMNSSKIVSEGVWVVAESVALHSLAIAEGAGLATPEGKSLTMTVDSIGTAIKPGTYKGDIFLTVTERFLMPASGLMRLGKPSEVRAAIVIDDGKFVREKSVPAIVQGGKVTDKATTGVSISGCEDSFNGIIVTGNSEYTIEGVTIDFEGEGGNDFIGLGAGITCAGNSRVTINNSTVKIKGVTRSVANINHNAVVTFNNCRLSNDSPATNKMYPTWMLGFKGSNRAIMHCDNAVAYYNNCYVSSNGWGVLSVDGGLHVRIYVKDSTIELTGPRARGYGSFSISDCFVSFDHCTLNVQGYPLLMGNSEGICNGEITGGSIVNSTVNGVVIFRDMGSELKVNKGSVLNTKLSTFIVKGSNSFLYVDNAVLNPKNGVILQLMDSDEPDLQASRFVVPVGEVDVPIPGRDLTAANPKEDVFMTVSNMEVTGDFYNSTTDLKANCRKTSAVEINTMLLNMPRMDIPISLPEGAEMDIAARQGVKNLDLKFANVRVKGIISAATAVYKEDVTVIDASNNEELGAITQTAHEPVNNGVIISFDKDCVWTVTGTSYLTSLTIACGAIFKAPAGKILTMTVDGIKKRIAPGTYTGKIVLEVV
jgi:hypothetical protein